jgi:futalosine hydrolase
MLTSSEDNNRHIKDRVLLVTATRFEVEPTLRFLGIADAHVNEIGISADPKRPILGAPGSVLELPKIDCLITGVGQMQCAATLMARLTAAPRYRLVIQAGIAGSFCAQRYPKCSVARVSHEFLGDLGAENNGSFLDIGEMGLLPGDGAPFLSNGSLVAPEVLLEGVDLSKLTVARSVTVNRVLSEQRSIDWIAQRFSPDLVNMEGAAMFYVCTVLGVPFIELRSVSDIVGPRDKSRWDIAGAVEALNLKLTEILSSASGRVIVNPTDAKIFKTQAY